MEQRIRLFLDSNLYAGSVHADVYLHLHTNPGVLFCLRVWISIFFTINTVVKAGFQTG